MGAKKSFNVFAGFLAVILLSHAAVAQTSHLQFDITLEHNDQREQQTKQRGSRPPLTGIGTRPAPQYLAGPCFAILSPERP
ncbi:MAG: hypothetical protein LC800_10170 [Acidobacteria bacterium]|nr:hypothetical protein [Acidobacteriota bacterium]